MVLNNLQRGVNCSDLLDVYKEYIERLVSKFCITSPSMQGNSNNLRLSPSKSASFRDAASLGRSNTSTRK